ncbi:MAG TPA: phasin family protein [Paraburkholderia sp.]|uniref:phasin family protein n=1 Tax=Paraburkholderia sp. TaxID=1926495 RepID=UPI002BA3462F|nr:phasin family protein [Paraburkholderia sp.]HTR05257.1 phasin family protein [Paraburkholderia sp.]
MESTNPTGLFAEYTKVIGQFKLPRIDIATVLEWRRKDIDALTEAGTTTVAGMQSLARKQSEILHTTMTGFQSLFARSTGSGSEPAPANPAALVQHALPKTLTDVQELADTAYRALSDSFAVITRRVAEHVEEWKALLQQGK